MRNGGRKKEREREKKRTTSQKDSDFSQCSVRLSSRESRVVRVKKSKQNKVTDIIRQIQSARQIKTTGIHSNIFSVLDGRIFDVMRSWKGQRRGGTDHDDVDQDGHNDHDKELK